MTIPTFDHRRLAGLFLAVVASAALWTSLRGSPAEELRLLPCAIHALTEVPCPGCGITRASVALLSGDLGVAWRLHPFAYLLVPLALLVLLAPGKVRAVWVASPRRLRTVLVYSALASCLLLWSWRVL